MHAASCMFGCIIPRQLQHTVYGYTFIYPTHISPGFQNFGVKAMSCYPAAVESFCALIGNLDGALYLESHGDHCTCTCGELARSWCNISIKAEGLSCEHLTKLRRQKRPWLLKKHRLLKMIWYSNCNLLYYFIWNLGIRICLCMNIVTCTLLYYRSDAWVEAEEEEKEEEADWHRNPAPGSGLLSN